MRRALLPAILLFVAPLLAYGHGGVDHSKKSAWPTITQSGRPEAAPLAGRAASQEAAAAAPIPDHQEASATKFWNRATAVSLAVLTLLYGVGLLRLRRSDAGRHTLPSWRAVSFVVGVTSAALALLGPLDRWSEILFSAHMAQHEILMLIAAPLMVAGKPFIATLWAFSPPMRAKTSGFFHHPLPATVWNRLTGPFTVLVIHAVVLWGWHIPVMYEAALHNETVHVVQHLGFFVSAALFWWALIHGRYGKLGYGVGVLYVFATAMHTQILGALLTFGSRIWYPTHAERTAAAGLQAVEDQQLAGIVMWIPFGVIFVFIGLALFAAWIGEAERRVAFTTAGRLSQEKRT